MRVTAITAAFAFALSLASCTPGGEPPVAAGLDSADAVVSAYLGEIYSRASAAPSSGAARGELAMAYAANDLNAAARYSYTQAATLDPDEFLWPYLLALMLAESGDVDEALTYLERAIELDGGYAPARMARGTYLLDLNRVDEAQAAFRASAELGIGPIAAIGIARTHLRQGNPNLAIDIVGPIVWDFPHPMAYRILGQALQALGRSDEAEIALLKGREAAPLAWPDERKLRQSAHARTFTGVLAHAQQQLAGGQVEEAMRELEALLERAPDDEAVLNSLSSALAQSGNLESAIALLEQAIERHPESFASHLNLAVHLQQRGEFGQALDHLRRAVALSPDLSLGHEMMGELLMRGGRETDARSAFEKARSPRGYYYLAMMAGASEDWDESIRQFDRSLALDPTDSRTLFFKARSLGEAGRIADARVALTRAGLFGTPPDEIASAQARFDEIERDIE